MPPTTPAPTSTTTITAPTRKTLPRDALSTGLRSAKSIILTDTTAPTPSSRGRPPPSTPSSLSRITDLAWSPLGSLLATADPKCLRVWNPEKPGVRYSTELRPSPSSTATSSGPQGRGRNPPQPSSLQGTERVAWRPNREAELASVGGDGVLRFWDVRSRGACVGEVKLGGEGYGLCWRGNGEEIVVSRKDDTLIPISRRTLSPLAHHQQQVQTNQILFTHSGNELILTSGDASVKILDYPSMTPLTTLTPHTSSITTAAHSPTGRHLAFGGTDALLTLWSTSDLTCRHSISSLPGPVRSVSFCFDGSYVVAGCAGDEGAPFPPSSSSSFGSAGGSSSFNAGGGAPAGGPAAGGQAGEITGIKIFHAESGEEVHEIATSAPTPVVGWHPGRYALALGGEGAGVRVLGVAGL